eukprot:Phypoly_transcript_11292.p2 GENE.Phypoly_transcript_11292~~Phypoly_transcript_11292.p2  ORF type:complete len:170 (+),score=22.80 Phypoly_transcript_11292:679-1188(+)
MISNRTLTAREIQTAVRLCIPGELAKHAISEGLKSVTKFCSTDDTQEGENVVEKKGRSGKRRNVGAKCGLQFSVGRVRTFLKTGMFAQRIGRSAPIYLAAVLEYLAAEILELAGNASKDMRRKIVIPRHVTLAIQGDEELDHLIMQYYNTRGTIVAGGVIPHIHKSLVH